MRRLALTLVLTLLGQLAGASGLDDALRDFARDVSGGDAKVASRVEQILANPPTTTEEIGFYGAANKSADERKFRAVIFRLSEAGHIFGFEDKYINELTWALRDTGWIANAPDTAAFIAKLEAAYDVKPTEADAIATRLLAQGFRAHVAQIEAAAAQAGRSLLYVDLPVGDTFHLVSLPEQTADKWRNVLFVKTPNERFAVTTPQWDIYYGFLTYALLLDTPEPSPVPAFDAPLKTLSQIGYLK